MKKYAIIMTAVEQTCLVWLKKKTLKYNPREKSLKATYEICIDLECIFKKKYNLVKTTLNNLIQKKRLEMNLLVAQFL